MSITIERGTLEGSENDIEQQQLAVRVAGWSASGIDRPGGSLAHARIAAVAARPRLRLALRQILRLRQSRSASIPGDIRLPDYVAPSAGARANRIDQPQTVLPAAVLPNRARLLDVSRRNRDPRAIGTRHRRLAKADRGVLLSRRLPLARRRARAHVVPVGGRAVLSPLGTAHRITRNSLRAHRLPRAAADRAAIPAPVRWRILAQLIEVRFRDGMRRTRERLCTRAVAECTLGDASLPARRQVGNAVDSGFHRARAHDAIRALLGPRPIRHSAPERLYRDDPRSVHAIAGPSGGAASQCTACSVVRDAQLFHLSMATGVCMGEHSRPVESPLDTRLRLGILLPGRTPLPSAAHPIQTGGRRTQPPRCRRVEAAT